MPDSRRQFAVINNKDHREIKVITRRGAEFGDAVMQAMAFPFEFRNLQAWYPIFFQVDRDGNYYPLVLFGFEEGENLFLSGPDWQAGYIPPMMRRDPFLIGMKDATDTTGDVRQARLLSLDMSHPRVSEDEGEPLFKTLGERSEFLEEQADLLETLHDGLEHCRAFTAALQEAALLEPVTLEIVTRDGVRNQLVGLSSIDEEKLQKLPASELEAFNREGFLMPLYMAVASMSNVQRLIELKNDKIEAGD